MLFTFYFFSLGSVMNLVAFPLLSEELKTKALRSVSSYSCFLRAWELQLVLTTYSQNISSNKPLQPTLAKPRAAEACR